MAKTKKRPGVILYFDVLPSLKRFSKEEKGELFEAIMEFAQYGSVPDLDGKLGVAWDFIMPRIIADEERYQATCQQNAENARKRWENEKKTDDYAAEDNATECERMPNNATECERMPNNANYANYNSTQLNSTPNSSSSSPSTSASDTASKSDGKGGEGGGLTMPRPLTEKEEQEKRSEFLRRLEQYQ